MEETLTFQEKVGTISNRVAEQYRERKRKYLAMSKEEILFNAYKIAHINEIEDIIIDMEEDEDDCRFSVDVVEKMLVFEGDIAEHVFNVWQDYNHPERYNFFTYEDLIDIVSSAFE